jgi:hypothetical protein
LEDQASAGKPPFPTTIVLIETALIDVLRA